jgi:hypothetical protein
MKRQLILLIIAPLLLSIAWWLDPVSPVVARQAVSGAYELTEIMVPMRDGVRLNTHIFRPRGQNSDLPIILASTRMAAHDFSTERLPICDSSMALPCTAADLHVAVQNAVSNNLIWQKRLEELDGIVGVEAEDLATLDAQESRLPVFAEAV